MWWLLLKLKRTVLLPAFSAEIDPDIPGRNSGANFPDTKDTSGRLS
jgi:hypothetical protein